jgi:hypothetical protein
MSFNLKKSQYFVKKLKFRKSDEGRFPLFTAFSAASTIANSSSELKTTGKRLITAPYRSHSPPAPARDRFK